jgi:hypothetical protein
VRTLAFLIALVTASAAVASVTHGRHTDRGRGGIELIASVNRGFGVNSVPVAGLYPGARRPLRVTITNTYAFPIKVAAPTAKVAATTNRAGCTGTAANLGVTSAGLRSLSLRAHKQKTVVLEVAMPSTVANACQGATFTISFRARATRA